MKNKKQTLRGLQERRGASPAPNNSGCAHTDASSEAKPSEQPRGEKTVDRAGRLSSHSVFVLSKDGEPLTPTKPARARKMLRDGVAKKVWSKFGIFGIQMLVEVGEEKPRVALGVDHGSKFEGYSVVVDKENVLNVKWNLPDKDFVSLKMKKRRFFRRMRRRRKCRRRNARFKNRCRKGFIAPSQMVLVYSRIKCLKELCRIYPVSVVGLENAHFNYRLHKWGRNFSSIDLGIKVIKNFFENIGVNVTEYRGYETEELRNFFGYMKINRKSEDVFESHCSDSLSLACAVGLGEKVKKGRFLVVDDVFRYYRRKLHDARPSKGGIRALYATGTVMGLKKGLIVGGRNSSGKLHGLAGVNGVRYFDSEGKRHTTRKIQWVKNSFLVKDMTSISGE